jgi:hypothetical protein
MRRLIERGVNNIITDDVELFHELKRERGSLTDAQKVLLAYRYLLE